MILYAIIETNTNLYVTRENGLDELGKRTKLFDSENEAKKAMRYTSIFQDEFYNPVRNGITWLFLEQKHGIDRRHLDISHREFIEMNNNVDLKIVKVQLNERKTKQKTA